MNLSSILYNTHHCALLASFSRAKPDQRVLAVIDLQQDYISHGSPRISEAQTEFSLSMKELQSVSVIQKVDSSSPKAPRIFETYTEGGNIDVSDQRSLGDTLDRVRIVA